jgi:hypothetical protein
MPAYKWSSDADVSLAGAWTLLGGEPLAHPIAVRVSTLPSGERVVTGLLIDTTPDAPVTSASLRSIAVSPILAQLFEPSEGERPPPGWDAYAWAQSGLEPATYQAVGAGVNADAHAADGDDGHDRELVEFARLYAREYARRRHGVVDRVHRQASMSRAKVGRWRRRAVDAGLLSAGVLRAPRRAESSADSTAWPEPPAWALRRENESGNPGEGTK